MLAEQLRGISLFPFQAMLIGLRKTPILAQQIMPLDGAGHDPDQSSRGGRMNAHIGVGVRFQAESGHLGVLELAKNDQWLFAAGRSQGFGQRQGVEFARLMADQNGVEEIVAQPRQAAEKPMASSSTMSEALSAARASASQPPVRWYVVT